MYIFQICSSFYTQCYLSIVQCVAVVFVVVLYYILLPVWCMYSFNSSFLLFNPVLCVYADLLPTYDVSNIILINSKWKYKRIILIGQTLQTNSQSCHLIQTQYAIIWQRHSFKMLLRVHCNTDMFFSVKLNIWFTGSFEYWQKKKWKVVFLWPCCHSHQTSFGRGNLNVPPWGSWTQTHLYLP